MYREIGDEGFNEDVNNSNQITLAQLYNGHYPDRDEEFWDHVSSSDMNIPLPVHQIAPYKLSIMLLSQYRIEHLDDLFDMMNEEQQETVQHYINDPNLSAQTIVIEDGRIIDGNHRALAAAIKKKPINAVDLMDLENQEVDEGVADWAKKGAVAGAMALGALGSGQADAKPIKPVQKPAIVQPAKQQTAPAKQQASTKSAPAQYNLLSNNPENEITLQKAARQAGMKGAELAQFMAQMKHESWDFDRMKEKAQPGVKDYYAKKYDMKYSPRTAKILGNKHAGDGARYHGRGFVQLTGRDNYRMASDAIGIDLLNHPDLASRPDVAAKVALWYWNTRVKPNVRNFADTATVTKYINPAARGLESRDSNFKDYMRII